MRIPFVTPALRRQVQGAGLALLAATVTTACSAHYVVSRPIDLARIVAPGPSLTSNVVLVSIDGLRPDAITTFAAPTLQRLMREGSYTLTASTINPSKTLPSHTSTVAVFMDEVPFGSSTG